MRLIGSPLRYPGGKTKALGQIAPLLPARFHSYREPFVGGGSLFINLTQQRPELPIWINDLNYDLYCFWQTARTDLAKLTTAVRAVKERATDGRKLFADLTTNCRPGELSDFERAVRFFVLNRITFSGTVEAGGYSQKAFESRFTDSSIERLARLTDVLTPDVRVTNLDYEQLLTAPGRAVFIFLDPPYLSATKSKLYGRRGALHTNFDHARFARLLQACRHKWLITYDDSPAVRRNFSFPAAHIYEWQLQYGMNNFGRTYAPKGKELFITNYPVATHDRAEQNAMNY
jgi:DNA adenine methylase